MGTILTFEFPKILMKAAFWVVAPCSPVDNRRFRGACRFLQLRGLLIALMTYPTLHDTSTHKTAAFILAAVRTWNLIFRNFVQMDDFLKVCDMGDWLQHDYCSDSLSYVKLWIECKNEYKRCIRKDVSGISCGQFKGTKLTFLDTLRNPAFLSEDSFPVKNSEFKLELLVLC
jgi:hypothetical protein